jgi:uncharacterized protein (DUF2225 family)
MNKEWVCPVCGEQFKSRRLKYEHQTSAGHTKKGGQNKLDLD